MAKLIGKIPKNDTVDIIIMIDDFSYRTSVNIREYIKSDKYTGFSRSGLKIPVEHFKDFKNLINSIKEKDFEE